MKEGERTARNLTKTVLSIIVAITLSVVVAPQISGPEPTDSGSWRIETVDTIDDVGMHSSVTLDSHNNPHISYSESSNWDLKYAHWDGSSWINETVDSVGDVGGSSSIALDGNDYPHISYTAAFPNWGLKYTKWTGSNWSIETVDSYYATGRWTSLALDSNDYPHISYWNDSNGEVRYAKWNGSSWGIEIIDIPGHAGSGSSLVLDSRDYPHISYPARGIIHYAKWNGSAWSIDIPDISPYTYGYNSIVLDSNDYPHIGYRDSNENIKYARWNGSAWELEIIDSSSTIGQFSSINLDSHDYPHMGYEANGYLRYARWNGSAWNIEVVDPACIIGDGSMISIFVDSRNIPHISYHDNIYQNLKYATKAGLLPPLPPTSLRTSVDNSRNIRLDWVASKSPNLTHYLIYRSVDQTDFDFTIPIYDTSLDVDPLRINWTDAEAASEVAPPECYYVVRVVNDLGLKSITSNTAGKWTKAFPEGRDAFSLPLEPFEARNISWYSENIPGIEFVRWMNSSGHWMTHYPSMGEGTIDIAVKMGNSYEVSLSSPIKFTFCGYPASMIRFQEGLGDFVVFRRSLTARIEGFDISLSWKAVAGTTRYLVFKSEERDGLHDLLLLPASNTTNTHWVDRQAIGNGESEYYYMVIPVDSSGGLGSSTYSIGVFTTEYQSGSDAFALPLKPLEVHSLDWYCDNIPNVVGIVHLMKGYWRLHAREMPEGVYDAEALQSEGYQISVSGSATTYTFVGY